MANATRPVLVIGSLNMDLVARCARLPAKGQTVFGNDFFTAAGGKGANQAVAAARLGAHVAMAGCVGRDDFGASLTAGLGAAGVDTQNVLPGSADRNRADHHRCRRRQHHRGNIRHEHCMCTAMVDRALASAGGPGILLLQHEIPDATNAYAIQVAQAAGWFVILNPAPAAPIPIDLLPCIALLVPNETEAAALTGRSVSSRADALAAAGQLMGQGARRVVITLGSDGALYCDATDSLHTPAVAVQAVDTTAAGDAYIGALGAALAEGRGLPDCLGFAAAAAALSVTRLGAQPSLASRAELMDFIASHGMPTPGSLAGPREARSDRAD